MLRRTEYRNYLISVLFGLFLLLLVGIFLLSYGKDNSFLVINKYNSPEFDYLFMYFTYLGDGIIWIPAFLYVLLNKKDFLVTLVAAVIICTLLTQGLKHLVFPYEFRPAAILKQHLHFVNGVVINRSNSFPSGHTSTAFTLAMLLAFLFKKRFWAFFFPLMALFVGYSRVYLAQHFVTDVFAGMIIGIISSYLSLIAYEYWKSRKMRKAAITDAKNSESIS
jgi:membrane-associated phospholipid phosphatase